LNANYQDKETKLEERETNLKGSEQYTTRLKRALSSKDAEIAKREVKIQKLQKKKMNCMDV